MYVNGWYRACIEYSGYRIDPTRHISSGSGYGAAELRTSDAAQGRVSNARHLLWPRFEGSGQAYQPRAAAKPSLERPRVYGSIERVLVLRERTLFET